MVFDFDIQKTIAAVSFLMEREGGELNMFLALKMLYLADKDALIAWGKPITGDSLVSMPKGPVLSEVYDLFKGTARNDHQQVWNQFFTEKVNNSIRTLREIDTGLLSQREMDVLESARQAINQMAPWDVPKWLHDTCPEWQDPHGSSVPIDPKTILRNAGKSEDQIRMIEESNDAFRYAKQLIRS